MIRKSNISKGKLSSFNRIQKNLEAVKNKLRAENLKPRNNKKSESKQEEKIVYEDNPKQKKRASRKEIKAKEEQIKAKEEEIKAKEEQILDESIEKAGAD